MSRHDRASAGSHRDKRPRGPAQPTSEELAANRADDIIRQSEASKARILDPTGRNVQILPNPNNPPHNINTRRVQIDDGYESDEYENLGRDGHNNLMVSHDHPSVVDENYLVIGNFVDEHIKLRIENGEYVDFSRLLPRDRLVIEEDN